jgi:hypothetical protein
MMEFQKRSPPRVREALEELGRRPALPAVLDFLGMPPRGPVRDDTFPVAPAGAVAQPQYIDQVRAGMPGGDPLAGIPAAPAGPAEASADLAARFPTPANFPGVMGDIFVRRGLPPASTPTDVAFADPAKAQAAWDDAERARARPRLFEMMRDMGRYLDEVAGKYNRTGCVPCFDALATSMDYLRTVTAAESARTGRKPPAPSQVEIRPFNSQAFRNALRSYGDWWYR